MTRVFPHTTKVGYSELRPYYTDNSEFWYNDGRGPYPYAPYSRPELMGIHFRSPLQGSDGHRPTNYSRIVIRARDEGGFEFTRPAGSGYYRNWGSNSFHGNRFQMHSQPWGQYGLSSGVVNPSEDLSANAISSAKAKLHGNQANILEDLAQARQTGVMAGSLFNQIGQKTAAYLAALYEYTSSPLGSGGNKGGPGLARILGPKPLRSLAKAWLVWYYGVKPLVSTINALGQNQSTRRGFLKVKAKRDRQLDPAGLFSYSGASFPFFTTTGSCKEEVTVELMVDYQLSDSLSLLANIGFHGGNPFGEGEDYGPLVNATDIATTAWALIPYSFVFDWLLPVESFLRSMYWSPQISYKGGYVTKYMGGYGRIQMRKHVWSLGERVTKNAAGRIDAVLFQRITYNVYPPPSILTVNQSISPSNLISAAALLAR